ncbi:flavodoxin I [Salinibacillus kushneri]|uniref:Flavodoxin I n=1 Tax=Salinibacillus kushneri TaxID=237682 RepID=A0A1I0F5T9_9BACI|nr:flavodoxin domain-containing protein [Salinibacillus kushneri]SET53396.1 flavodoxin I [Salinibacillus kushneri]
MKILIIYTSITGNTEQLMHHIATEFARDTHEIDIFRVSNFSLPDITDYDVVLIGTYSWGNGDLPIEMEEIYEAFEEQEVQHIVTGVFGTGDRFYPHFCGAVDCFKDMLYFHTKLAVTLKVELMPQEQDIQKCRKFYHLVMNKVKEKNLY